MRLRGQAFQPKAEALTLRRLAATASRRSSSSLGSLPACHNQNRHVRAGASFHPTFARVFLRHRAMAPPVRTRKALYRSDSNSKNGLIIALNWPRLWVWAELDTDLLCYKPKGHQICRTCIQPRGHVSSLLHTKANAKRLSQKSGRSPIRPTSGSCCPPRPRCPSQETDQMTCTDQTNQHND